MGLIGTLKIVSCLGGANSVSYASASQVGPGNTEIRDLPKFVADLKFYDIYFNYQKYRGLHINTCQIYMDAYPHT
jgi:hypothetical protein